VTSGVLLARRSAVVDVAVRPVPVRGSKEEQHVRAVRGTREAMAEHGQWRSESLLKLVRSRAPAASCTQVQYGRRNLGAATIRPWEDTRMNVAPLSHTPSTGYGLTSQKKSEMKTDWKKAGAGIDSQRSGQGTGALVVLSEKLRGLGSDDRWPGYDRWTRPSLMPLRCRKPWND
jgi:hypothetical protein